MSEEIYKQQIIDRYQSPRHQGELSHPTFEASLSNPLCGDQLHIQVMVNNHQVQGMTWQGEGCAISLAAADLLADKVVHLQVDQVQNLTPADMLSLLGIKLKPSREKCATLALDCVKAGLDKAELSSKRKA